MAIGLCVLHLEEKSVLRKTPGEILDLYESYRQIIGEAKPKGDIDDVIPGDAV